MRGVVVASVAVAFAVAVAVAVAAAWPETDGLCGLRVGPTPLTGRGVFATRAYGAGEVVERCPMVVEASDRWGPALDDYLFRHDAGDSALSLGYCSVYNHRDDPNTTYEYDDSLHGPTMVVRATRDISTGDEIFVTYGSAWWAARAAKRKVK